MCFKGARSQGCPWDERTCANAARGGHLEVLQWAKARLSGMRRHVPVLLAKAAILS